jgi:hypothetical protein
MAQEEMVGTSCLRYSRLAIHLSENYPAIGKPTCSMQSLKLLLAGVAYAEETRDWRGDRVDVHGCHKRPPNCSDLVTLRLHRCQL